MVRPPKRTHDVWSATLAVFRRLTFLSRRDPSRHRACRAVCRDAPGAVPYFVTSAAVGASRQQQTLWALLRCMSWPRARAPCRLHHDSRRHCGCRCDARRATHAVAVGAVTTHTAAGAPTLWRRCQRVPGVDGHRRRGRRHDDRQRRARPCDNTMAAGAITPHHLVQRPQRPPRHCSAPSHCRVQKQSNTVIYYVLRHVCTGKGRSQVVLEMSAIARILPKNMLFGSLSWPFTPTSGNSQEMSAAAIYLFSVVTSVNTYIWTPCLCPRPPS